MKKDKRQSEEAWVPYYEKNHYTGNPERNIISETVDIDYKCFQKSAEERLLLKVLKANCKLLNDGKT